MGIQEKKCSICNDTMENHIKDNKGRGYCSEECAVMAHLDGKLESIVYSTINLCCNDLLVGYLEKGYYKDINKDKIKNQKLTKNNCDLLDMENGCDICHCCLEEEIIDSNGNKYCSEECVVMAKLDNVLESITYSTVDLWGYDFLEKYLKEGYFNNKNSSSSTDINTTNKTYNINKCCVCNSILKERIEDSNGKYYCSEECTLVNLLDGSLGRIVSSTVKFSLEDVQALVVTKVANNSGIYHSISGNSKIFSDNYVLSAQQGHGYAAEKANNLIDKALGLDSSIIGDDLKANGADRLVNGAQIQTKYCKTPSKTIGSCFKNGKMKYVNNDGTPMEIEVPAEQYEEALKLMEKRIKNGEVDGINDIQKAKDIIRKGRITYLQARNIAKLGTIDSIIFDAVNGIQVAGTSMGISAIIAFANSVWEGKDIDIALENSIYEGVKVGGITWVTSIAISQIGRSGFQKTVKVGTDYLVKTMGSKATAILANAVKPTGRNIYGAAASNALSKYLSGNIVTGIVTTSILSINDINKLVRGRISSNQAFKNVMTTVSGIAGGTTGTIAGGIVGGIVGTVVPGAGNTIGAKVGGTIGGVIGGIISSKAAKNTLDKFVEDDIIIMQRIFEEEFNNLIFEYMLTEDEINILFDNFEYLDLREKLNYMYSSSDKNIYARRIVRPLIEELVRYRDKIEIPDDEQVIKKIGSMIDNLVVV